MLYEVITEVQLSTDALICPDLVVVCSPDQEVGPCLTQGQVDDAFSSWLDGFSVSGASPIVTYTVNDVIVDVITSYSIHYTKLYERAEAYFSVSQ